MADIPEDAVSTEEGEAFSETERLILALQTCFHELIKKQEEQADRIHRAVEALKPPESVDTNTAFWGSYMKLADEHDKEFQKKYSNDLDTALIFAGLFSAVSSAFIIQIQPEITTAVQPELTSPPPAIVVLAQSLLYISLFTTLFAALLAVLGKQWITYYDAAGSRGSIEERGLERQRKLDGLRQWKFDVVLQSFPLLLQLAVFLFSAALSIYLWTVHRTLAIIAMLLTSSAFTTYILLLASALVSTDSPFQTPLASLLLWFAYRTKVIWALRRKIPRALRQFLKWSTASLLNKSPRQILPSFGSNLSSQTSSQTLYSEHEFMPPSPEIPAVLWVLETSTEPRMVELAAKMAVKLQWPSVSDLRSPTVRLLQTFNSCFEFSDGMIHNVRPGAIHRAINCGRAYCSLRVAAWRHPWYIRRLNFPPNHDPEFLQLLDVLRIVRGNVVARGDPTELVGPREDSFAVEWALHTIPSPATTPSSTTTTFQIESRLNAFLDQFPPSQMDALNHSGFANYLCCINSFLAPIETRVVAQLDKSSFRENLITSLFRLLKTTNISSSLVKRTIHNVQLLDKFVGRKNVATGPETRLSRLFVAVTEFCAALPQADGWIDVTVSAVKLARVNRPENWTTLHRVGQDVYFGKATPQNVEWIYRAVDHVQRLWERWNPNARNWNTSTADAVDSLLQLLASSGDLPDKPPSRMFQAMLQALSDERTCLSAVVVLYRTRKWFLDLDLQELILGSAVWPQVAAIAMRYPLFFGWRYIEIVDNISRGSPEWKSCLYPQLYAWLTTFAEVTDYPEYETWVKLEQFTDVTCGVWVPGFHAGPHVFADKAEQNWALTISALGHFWEFFDFAKAPALRDALRLTRCTAVWALKTQYYPPRGPAKYSRNRSFTPAIQTAFAAQLAESLRRAVANARTVLAQPSQLNVILNARGLERVVPLLEVLGQKLKVGPGPGQVELGGSVKGYDNWWQLLLLFQAETDAAGKLLHIDFGTG